MSLTFVCKNVLHRYQHDVMGVYHALLLAQFGNSFEDWNQRVLVLLSAAGITSA